MIRKDVSQAGIRELEGILGWEGEGIEFLEEPRLSLDPWNCPKPGWSSLEGGRCPCAWQGVALDDPEIPFQANAFHDSVRRRGRDLAGEQIPGHCPWRAGI